MPPKKLARTKLGFIWKNLLLYYGVWSNQIRDGEKILAISKFNESDTSS